MNMSNIQPQYLTLSDLLNKRLFIIPEYQRAYSWTKYQREDLFDDIESTHIKGDDNTHFMATVVCLRKKKEMLGTDEFYLMEVVDGQQRLTTLIILLNALKAKLNKDNASEAKVQRELGELLVKVEGNQLLLLQTNHDSSHYFANYLRQGLTLDPEIARTIADREILLAIKECNDFIDKWIKKKLTLVHLAALLKNRLWFLLHEVGDAKTVYTVFEVLNSRGLDVSWLDRLKSILMGAVYGIRNTDHAALINELHVIWRDIYKVIGLTQGLSTEALRFAATLRTKTPPSRLLGEEDSVEELRGQAKTAKDIRDVASWLLSVTEACETIVGNPRIAAVTEIAQARLLATAISVRTDLAASERKSLLENWEKVSFRIYGMLRNDARTRVGEYTRLAWHVVNQKLTAQAIAAGIFEIGKGFPVSEATAALRNANCYEGWETELRYVMCRYEEHLARAQKLKFSNEQWEKIWAVSPSESIEHVWAESKAPEKDKHRLGNLILLPPRLNSSLQDKDPQDKRDSYQKTGLLIAGKVSDTIVATGWNTNAIDARENELIAWALTEWVD